MTEERLQDLEYLVERSPFSAPSVVKELGAEVRQLQAAKAVCEERLERIMKLYSQELAANHYPDGTLRERPF